MRLFIRRTIPTVLVFLGAIGCGRTVFRPGAGNSKSESKVAVDESKAPQVANKELDGSTVDASASPEALKSQPAEACAPRGRLPAGFTFIFDQKIGGSLALHGSAGPDVLVIAGRDVAGEILFNGGIERGGFTFVCVKSFQYFAGAGNDSITLEGVLKGIDDPMLDGGEGDDTFSVNTGGGNANINGGA